MLVAPEVLERLVAALMEFAVDSLRQFFLIWRVLFVSLHFKINYKILPPKLLSGL